MLWETEGYFRNFFAMPQAGGKMRCSDGARLYSTTVTLAR
jgi:hypothetical protein